MKIFTFILSIFVFAGVIARAQLPMQPLQVGTGTTTPAYTGPGDIVSQTFWCGLRAYSSATRGNNAINIRRASDNTTRDIATLVSTGALDTATASTFCNATTCFATKCYDQTGNGNDLVQATNANQPTLLFSGCTSGSLPCLSFTGSPVFMATASTLSGAADGTWVAVANYSAAGAYQVILGQPTQNITLYANSSNLIDCYNGTDNALSGTAGGNWYALVYKFTGGSSGSCNANALTTSALANSTSTAIMYVGQTGAGAFYLTGKEAEVGGSSTQFSSGQITSMISNQRTYWNF